jgi:mannose-6-phosphate isomerase-like protein (cupin superfamily)
MVKPDEPQPVFAAAGSGRVLDYLGVTHLLTTEQSAGAIYIFESVFEPGTGNSLHVHSREDEIAYVLEGALVVRLPDRSAIVEAGGIARLPKNLPHAIRNPLGTPSRYLFLAVPGGLDRWFDAVSAADGDGTLDDALFRRLSEEFGIGWLE